MQKIRIAVGEPLQRGSDEWLLLRARYIELIQGLDQTREWNSATLDALGEILPSHKALRSLQGGPARVSWPLDSAREPGRIAA